MEAFRQRSAARNYTTGQDKQDITSPPRSRPELQALHNEWKIQAERVHRWVEEWRDETSIAATDGGNKERATQRQAIAETVSSIWDNVKRIITEVDQLQFGGGSLSADGSEQRTSVEKDQSSDKAPLLNRAPRSDSRWTMADRARFAELSDEMKNSVALLFDLLNSRKELRVGTSPVRRSIQRTRENDEVYSADRYQGSQETLVNPTRSSTTKTTSSLELPPRLDPDLLVYTNDQPPPYHGSSSASSSRQIAFLTQPMPPSQARLKDDDTVSVPVLIEYAHFDEVYRATGTSPPWDRLDNLLSYYGRCGASVNYSTNATLPCLGFFEDPKQPRVALVYELPRSAVGDVSQPANKEQYEPASLLKLLQLASTTVDDQTAPTVPALEERYRLAFNILQAFSRMHLDETTLHKDVNSDNILFFRNRHTPETNFGSTLYDLRLPYITSYDLFTEFSFEKSHSSSRDNLYRHPEDPRLTGNKCDSCNDPVCRCPKVRLDLYGLAMILIEIGMWAPASALFEPSYDLKQFRTSVEQKWLRMLPSRMGNIYANTVRDLFAASDKDRDHSELYSLYERNLTRLRRCLVIDEDDETSSMDSSPAASFRAASSRPQQTHRSSSQHSYTYHGITGQYTVGFTPMNPLATLGNITRPLARLLGGTRRPTPRSVPEGNHEDGWQLSPQSSFATQDDDGSFTPKTVAQDQFGATEMTSITVERLVAAQTIQKAWRVHRGRPSLRDYRRNVTIVQRQWRRQLSRRATVASSRTFRDSIYVARDIEGLNMGDYNVQRDAMITISHSSLAPRPKLRIFANKLQPEILAAWESLMLPRLEKLISRALRDSDESSSIDLVSLGETATLTKPTVMITCTSTGKVKKVLERRFEYDHTAFDLKVRKGKIRRSKVAKNPKRRSPHRSMVQQEYSHPGNAPLNPYHQQRPLCGASIGAFTGGKHLPPVSYGGAVDIDGETYGMTVHHLLDAPSDDESDNEEEATLGASRSSAGASNWFDQYNAPSLQSIPSDPIFPLELSDDDFDDSDIISADVSDDGYSSAEEEPLTTSFVSDSTAAGTQGDLSGILPDQDSRIPVTQPALDDVDESFFPNRDDRDEDHMDSHELGYVHASSGIRRWIKEGISHEIDWALIKMNNSRLQPYNLVQGGKKYRTSIEAMSFRPKLEEPVCRGGYTADEDEYPHQIAPSSDLADLRVHCFGRTSGLKGGVIGSAMSSVRIYRRRSFSRQWSIVGEFGVGGDSGAWVIDNQQGRVCGHVLAWCERNAIAYICPMEILLEDIRRTLRASRICIPGGSDLQELQLLQSSQKMPAIEGLSIAGAVRSSKGAGTFTDLDRNDSKFNVSEESANAAPRTPELIHSQPYQEKTPLLDVSLPNAVETPPDTPRSEYSDRSLSEPRFLRERSFTDASIGSQGVTESPISHRRAAGLIAGAVAEKAAAIAAAAGADIAPMPGLASAVGSNKRNLGLGIGLIPRTERDTRPIWR